MVITFANSCLLGLAHWPTHVAHVTDGTIVSMNNMKSFAELDEIKAYHQKQGLLDSPLMALCYRWLREDRERLRNKKQQQQLEPGTGLPHTKWDELKDDMDKHGDKYYNYWK